MGLGVQDRPVDLRCFPPLAVLGLQLNAGQGVQVLELFRGHALGPQPLGEDAGLVALCQQLLDLYPVLLQVGHDLLLGELALAVGYVILGLVAVGKRLHVLPVPGDAVDLRTGQRLPRLDSVPSARCVGEALQPRLLIVEPS